MLRYLDIAPAAIPGSRGRAVGTVVLIHGFPLSARMWEPQLVLAEYNGGPLNAGYFRAGGEKLAQETRSYVPRVLALHARLKEAFEKGPPPQLELMHMDLGREGKTLGGR